MKFIAPDEEELSYLRADPLLVEQELDVRPDVALALEQATGVRRGYVYWRSRHDYLYGLELGDLGRDRPSTATLYGFWDRYEPRPPEHEIDADLLDFLTWFASISGSIEPSDVQRVAGFAGIRTTWADGAVLRTPEERFDTVPDFPHSPRYIEVEGLRMAYVEAGDGDPIVCLHGEPTWGYLYRQMIEPLAVAGRVIVPDLIGFGRSDKPVAENAYSYRSHTRWLRRFFEELDLQRVTLVCQDWGGLLGLRLLAQMPRRFVRLVAMNTGFPTGERRPGAAFMRWRLFSQRQQAFDVPALMRDAVRGRTLSEAEAAAYGAPFPSVEYQSGALVFPRLVPTRPDHPGAYDNRRAVEVLRTLDLPVLLPWAELDAITGHDEGRLRAIFKNVAPQLVVAGAGHFIQEDRGAEVAERIVRWMQAESYSS
ncbi:MAG: haloalkane dehalogenase [Dehalococcoidia bacterium]